MPSGCSRKARRLAPPFLDEARDSASPARPSPLPAADEASRFVSAPPLTQRFLPDGGMDSSGLNAPPAGVPGNAAAVPCRPPTIFRPVERRCSPAVDGMRPVPSGGEGSFIDGGGRIPPAPGGAPARAIYHPPRHHAPPRHPPRPRHPLPPTGPTPVGSGHTPPPAVRLPSGAWPAPPPFGCRSPIASHVVSTTGLPAPRGTRWSQSGTGGGPSTAPASSGGDVHGSARRGETDDDTETEDDDGQQGFAADAGARRTTDLSHRDGDVGDGDVGDACDGTVGDACDGAVGDERDDGVGDAPTRGHGQAPPVAAKDCDSVYFSNVRVQVLKRWHDEVHRRATRHGTRGKAKELHVANLSTHLITKRIGELSRLLEKMPDNPAVLRLLEKLIDGGESSAADRGARAAEDAACSDARALGGTGRDAPGARAGGRAACGARAEAGDSTGELVDSGSWEGTEESVAGGRPKGRPRSHIGGSGSTGTLTQ
ncbi:hypothetical protein I4F81_003743 [Pyropia yezoensis]|uniref:Uncharacterized protein n=1 Tax=Pyropia yezoensis TaxID=2788 RepID=A0ACC3BTX2_PYRYE|nr:hypothetical protein I4F81_003743 [Neopyropia yezoensis]